MSDVPADVLQVDLVAPQLSVAREKIIEHRLVSDLAALMLRRGTPIDVLRSEFDAQGHDLVFEGAGVIRHVQLKASVDGGKRRHVDINVRLRAKPSGCVVWMSYDPVTLAITAYRWFGADAGEPLPHLGDRVTRHTKADVAGTKAQRPALRNVPGSKFEVLTGLDALADRLFGPPHTRATSLVLGQLRQQFGSGWREAVLGASGKPGFYGSAELALLIDGYRVLEQLCELNATDWLERAAAAPEEGSPSPDLGLLWTRLFLEHRRWRFSSPYEPQGHELVRLDALAAAVEAALQEALSLENDQNSSLP